jgi:DnaJ-class molecular chaperone
MSIKGLDFDPYTVLNVARDATKDQLIRAFREQALKWHPDKNPDNIDTGQYVDIFDIHK